ncbi:MAG: PilZ domain-containing protein [Proteobacteria bacterium]|nr:PilZ domain-containing protein [Pseudomonadota bacterium]
MIEKREVPRVPVSMKVDNSTQGKIVFGYARDISKRGIAVNAEIIDEKKDLPMIGDTFSLKFKLPSAAVVISAVGKVVRMDLYEGKPPVLGMEFIDLEPEFGVVIDDFVKRLMRL